MGTQNERAGSWDQALGSEKRELLSAVPEAESREHLLQTGRVERRAARPVPASTDHHLIVGQVWGVWVAVQKQAECKPAGKGSAAECERGSAWVCSPGEGDYKEP